MKTKTLSIFNIKHAALGIAVAGLLLSSTFMPVQKAQAATTNELLAQIQQLMQIVASLQQQLAVQRGGAPATVGSSCIELTRSMYLGSNDASTAGQVGKLQRFLQSTGHYTYGEITGYYGPATQQAVQRWQAANGVVSSGSPDTTGFGLVGSQTRAAMSLGCVATTESKITFDSKEEEEQVGTDVQYDIEITSPRNNAVLYAGDTVQLTWRETGLEYEEAIVTLENGRSTFDLKEHVDVGDQGVRVTLPDYKKLGLVTEASYELKLWVSYVKDGSPKAVSDTVQIKIKPRFASTEQEESEDLDPSITLKSPKQGEIFDKSDAGDDIVIKWEAEDVPVNTNVIYKIEAVESYAGAFVTGSGGQVKARSGLYTHKIAIDIPGTLDPGEYKIRLLLEECHSLGCNVSYSFGPLKESLEIYDRSAYGYFTIINSNDASVTLKIPGTGDTKVWGADADDIVPINYYPTGNIDECKITATYDAGKFIETHPWPNTILSGQYGRSSFSVASPDGVLEKIQVDCTDENGLQVASDSIEIYVDQDTTAGYKIIVAGSTVNSGVNVSEAKARSICSAAYNDEYRGKRVQCFWDGDEFFDDTNWKG